MADEKVEGEQFGQGVGQRGALAHDGRLPDGEAVQQAQARHEVALMGSKSVPDGGFHQRPDFAEVHQLPGIPVMVQLQANGRHPSRGTCLNGMYGFPQDGYALQAAVTGDALRIEKKVARCNAQVGLGVEGETAVFVLEWLRDAHDVQVPVAAGGKGGEAALAHRVVKKLVVVDDQKGRFGAGATGNQGGNVRQVFRPRLAEFEQIFRNAVFRAVEKSAYARPGSAGAFAEAGVPAHHSLLLADGKIFPQGHGLAEAGGSFNNRQSMGGNASHNVLKAAGKTITMVVSQLACHEPSPHMCPFPA